MPQIHPYVASMGEVARTAYQKDASSCVLTTPIPSFACFTARTQKNPELSCVTRLATLQPEINLKAEPIPLALNPSSQAFAMVGDTLGSPKTAFRGVSCRRGASGELRSKECRPLCQACSLWIETCQTPSVPESTTNNLRNLELKASYYLASEAGLWCLMRISI